MLVRYSVYKGRDFFSAAQEVCEKSRLFRKIAAAIFVSGFYVPNC